jgi:hypothetical protein
MRKSLSERMRWLPALMLASMLSWTGCLTLPQQPTATAAPAAKVSAPLPLRPVLTAAQRALIKSGPKDEERLIIDHELDWNGYADKMEAR